MVTFAGFILLFFIGLRISIIDIKTHFIQNIDLILLFSILLIFFEINLQTGCINFLIYLLIYFLTGRKLGFGDVKLSFILGLVFQSFLSLIYAINLSWAMGGVWALLSKQRKIAFAPWMLSGACLAEILVV